MRETAAGPPVPYCVLGSGASGVASARALLDRGCEVALLDVGVQLDAERRARLDALRGLDAERLPEAMGDLAPRTLPSPEGGFPLKLAFGSAFPYALEAMAELTQEGTRCVESHARGGLTNVWGAAVLPLRAQDLADWPIAAAELDPHYAAVARFMPVCGGRDDLEASFPYRGPAPGRLEPSRQARALLERLRRHGPELRRRGYLFGQARLAVDAPPAEAGCQSLGLCLTGCPLGSIFNAAHALDEMRAHPRFRYLDGLRAERVEEAGGHANVLARRAAGGALESFAARRVLVALGVVSTIKLVLRSWPASDPALELRYHPYFLMPLFLLRGTSGVARERLHTLAQLFLEVEDADVSPQLVHLQLYTFSPQLEAEARAALRGLGPLGRWVVAGAVGRLAAIQGYLHSAEAPPIRVRAVRRAGGAVGLRLTAGDTRSVALAVGRLAGKLRRDARLTGFFPIPLAVRVGKPGDGNHVGGVFPMRRSPGAFETDSLGRLAGRGRIHLVDASILPSLPATTITYTAMANAHRIAARLAEERAGEAFSA